jgi:4-amino-4-deoxy-L-arabinose transferase-like glycosyltransferase
LLVHGASLGLTDDEAYYWALAQHPALGFAYHPPAVVWSIAASQKLLGWLFGNHSALVVRLPAIAITGAVVALSLDWMKRAGAPRERLGLGALALLSLAGVFASSWMMVPDLPMLLGWMLLFWATWRLCFEKEKPELYWLLAFGAAWSMLSKYSAVLHAGSAGLAILIWAKPRVRVRGVVAICAGIALALIPILIWNAQHEWGSLLYQIRDRHEHSGLSLKRYLRFWSSQILVAGPVLVYFAFALVRRLKRRESLYVFVWAAPPALVFLTQPLFSEFKPHWALIVWLPVAIELGLAWSRGEWAKAARAQACFGLTLATLALLFCHLPLSPWATEKFLGKQSDPRWDVTNDMYGWAELPEFLKARGLSDWPVLGSRYQTASQAAFALGSTEHVALIPRDYKQKDEWLELGVTDHYGPEWPKLLRPVVFVADNRYSARAEFKDATCTSVGKLEAKRWSYIAKQIDVYRCVPVAMQP